LYSELVTQGLLVELGELASSRDDLLKPLKLRKSKGSRHFGHSEISGSDHELPAELSVISQHPELLREIIVVCEAKPTLSGRDDLPWMKAQAGDLSEAPARSVHKSAAQRAGRIFDDGKRAEPLADLLGPRWVSKLVDHDGRARIAVARLAKCGARAVPFIGVDIDEPDLGSGRADRMCGTGPTKRGAEHFVARTDLQSPQGQLERGRPARHRNTVPAPDERRYSLLETLDQSALNQLARFEYRRHGAPFILADPWFC
jgi:hypothetical protein